VGYAVTPLGATPAAIIGPIRTWADAHMDDIDEARGAYDAMRAAEQDATAG
jgi:DNA-binding HxlR family transcriptional regulator